MVVDILDERDVSIESEFEVALSDLVEEIQLKSKYKR